MQVEERGWRHGFIGAVRFGDATTCHTGSNFVGRFVPSQACLILDLRDPEGAMSQSRQHLEETDRLLAESKARIHQQKQVVADLETATVKAKAILREFEDTQLLIVSYREALIRELAKDPGPSTPPPLLERHG